MADADGSFESLVAFLDHAVAEGSVRTENRAMLLVGDTPSALLDAFAAYRAPEVTRWLEQGDI